MAKNFIIQNIICYFAPQKKLELTNLKFIIMSEVTDRVKAIIVEKLGVADGQVTPEASFTTDLGADSLDTVDLIMDFEKEFGIKISDEDAEKIQTVGDAVSYIEKAVAAE